MRYVLVFIFIVLFTINYFMGGPGSIQGNFATKLISYFNFLLFISSIITFIQFFWPGDKVQTGFQLFNLFFTAVFYTISFTFLVHHKSYYDGYTYLTDFGCVQHFAFRWDIFSIMFWFILVACVLNVLYLIRYREASHVYA